MPGSRPGNSSSWSEFNSLHKFDCISEAAVDEPAAYQSAGPFVLSISLRPDVATSYKDLRKEANRFAYHLRKSLLCLPPPSLRKKGTRSSFCAVAINSSRKNQCLWRSLLAAAAIVLVRCCCFCGWRSAMLSRCWRFWLRLALRLLAVFISIANTLSSFACIKRRRSSSSSSSRGGCCWRYSLVLPAAAGPARQLGGWLCRVDRTARLGRLSGGSARCVSADDGRDDGGCGYRGSG